MKCKRSLSTEILRVIILRYNPEEGSLVFEWTNFPLVQIWALKLLNKLHIKHFYSPRISPNTVRKWRCLFRSRSHWHSLCLSVVCLIAQWADTVLSVAMGLLHEKSSPSKYCHLQTPPQINPVPAPQTLQYQDLFGLQTRGKNPLLFSQSHQTHKIFNL